MPESVLLRLFAGVPSDDFDIIPLVPLGQWLLPVGIFLLAMGFYAEREGKTETLSLYRYGTVSKWWGKRFGKAIRFGIRTGVLLLLIALTWDFAAGKLFAISPGLVGKISTLWLLHSVSMGALFTLLDLFPVRRFAPAALFLLEGVTFCVGCRVREVSHGMYGMWGMYLRSSFCSADGFPAGWILGLEGFLTATCFFAGRMYLKKETNFI